MEFFNNSNIYYKELFKSLRNVLIESSLFKNNFDDDVNHLILSDLFKKNEFEKAKQNFLDYLFTNHKDNLRSNDFSKIYEWYEAIYLNWERAELLITTLSDFKKHHELITRLSAFEFDFKVAIFIVDKGIILKYLLNYLNGNITADELSEWAYFIEVRDDVGVDIENAKILRDIIFWLSSPELNYELNQVNVKEIFIEKLNAI
ncbi:hypothetical protein [Leptospira borgpetersenii]|uniref:hypothetical protein n=1 Tax=Leptospira borgpetersenii TaxID=174 RepID=UPI00077497B0|nr:hypothetical protein [Leptospira borgpetersenii]MBF3377886.1 hypothetical protein [Leptospira borgpetersenii serovar Balcanica]